MLSLRLAGGAGLSVLILLAVLATPRPLAGQPPNPQPADQDAIDRAIENGVRYLRATQRPDGVWGKGTGPGSGKGWGVGYTSLVGVALVECGVPTSDPGLRRAHAWVKSHIAKLEQTYEVSLAILFLDRMGEKRDRRGIETLTARLIAGQTQTGGWGYKVPILTSVEQEYLLNALRKMTPPQLPPLPSFRARPPSLGLCIKSSDDVIPRTPPAFDAEQARASALRGVPPGMRRLPAFLDMNELVLEDPKDPKRTEPITGRTDNSNTHFAMLAMWAARKHNIPVERSLVLLVNRFRTSQGADGTWGYGYSKGGGGGRPALTCVALLGLAIGHVVDPDIAVRPEQDPRVIKAFVWLSKRIDQPAGTIINRPDLKRAGGLYYMWAMERIAVLYDVGSLDRKDWYLWGAEILLSHQKPEGNWEDTGSHVEHPALSTSLALLFLKRANLTPDLSRRLVVDPSALTQKVSDTVTPRPPPVTPTPNPPPTNTVTTAPMPREVVETQPEPDPTPTPTAPTASDPPTPEPTTTTPEKSSKLPWIILLVVLIGVFGTCAFLVVRRMRTAAEEEVKPRKKKKKLKPKAEE